MSMTIVEAREIAKIFLQFVNVEPDFGLFVFVLKCSYRSQRWVVARMLRRQARRFLATGDREEARRRLFAASLLRSVDRERSATTPWPRGSVS